MTEDHKEDRRCTATAKGSGVRCKRTAIPGGSVCVKHGGGAPQVREAAAVRLLQRQAVLAAETFGLPRQIDPHGALLEELHRTAGAVTWLSAVVAELDQATVGGHALVALWQSERDRLARVAKTCVDVGIEERRVRLAESAGAQLAAVVRAVLDRLGLSDEQRVLALSVVPEEFRRLGGDVVEGEVVA